MRLEIKANILKKSLKGIAALVDEAKFTISENGIVSKSVDPANVAMVSLELDKEAFQTFEANTGEFAIMIKPWLEKLEMVQDKEDIVGIVTNPTANNKLDLVLPGLTYTVSLLDPSGLKTPKIPPLTEQLTARVIIRGGDLKFGLKAAEKVGEYMVFEAKGEELFSMECIGDTDKVRYERTKEQLIALNQLHGAKAEKSLFSLDYLHDIKPTFDNDDEVTLLFGTDFPLKLNFDIADKHGRIGYMLAPRVDSGN